MAFMNPPEDVVNSEDLTELADVAVLEEDGDVEGENTEYGGVVAMVESAFRRSKDHRLSDETRWLMSYRNYRGIYGPGCSLRLLRSPRPSLRSQKPRF
jgi:hypothetical protein